MFSRIRNTLAKVQIGSASRFARGIAGGVGGIFFVMHGVFTAPLKKFLYGFGPAGTTFLVSSTAFIYRMINNFKAAHPADATVELKRRQKELSTSVMMDMLKQNPDKTRAFLEKNKISGEDIRRLEQWLSGEPQDVDDILKKIFKAVEFDLAKYPASFIFALMTAASHYIEWMLMQVNVDPEMVNLNLTMDQLLSTSNILITGIAVLAIAQGVMEFVSVKRSYENVDDVAMHAEILKKLSAFQPPAEPADREGSRIQTGSLSYQSIQ